MSKNLLWLTLVWIILGCAPATESRLPYSPSPLDALDQAIATGAYGNVDRLLVLREGTPLLDRRYERDYREISRGHVGALGCGYQSCPDDHDAADPFNYYDPDTHPYYRGRDVHTLQSVTKSIAATLVGIAIGRGEIEGVDAPLLSFFAGYDLSVVDDRLHRATLDDLLTMRSGIRWDEGPLDETDTTLRLEHSDDWIQFTLSQPSDAAPGEKWVYNSGGSHLISGVIRQATGQHVDAYAETHLFGPLGIRDYHWKKTPRGYGDTEGGLYLAAEDLARIGLLYLQDGVWNGRRLLPEGWVEAATARRVDQVGQGWGYGYQWWRLDRRGVEIWAGLGFGGQALFILPQHQMVGVVNSWNIFDEEHPSIHEAFADALVDSVSG